MVGLASPFGIFHVVAIVCVQKKKTPPALVLPISVTFDPPGQNIDSTFGVSSLWTFEQHIYFFFSPLLGHRGSGCARLNSDPPLVSEVVVIIPPTRRPVDLSRFNLGVAR